MKPAADLEAPPGAWPAIVARIEHASAEALRLARTEAERVQRETIATRRRRAGRKASSTSTATPAAVDRFSTTPPASL